DFLGHEVVNMDWLAVQNSAACGPPPRERKFDEVYRDRSVMSSKDERIVLAQEDRCIVCVAKPGSGLDQCVEHCLEIECRAADDLEYVSVGGLLWKRSTDFIKQPRILNSNARWRGKILPQLDLFVGKRPSLLAKKGNCTERCFLLEHRHDRERPGTA